jgi:transcriptional regulator with XRE-family HTH domain
MRSTGTSQSRLAEISGIRQPTISQVLGGKIGISDEQLDRLLSCMGFQLEVVRRPVLPKLTRSELRSWRLHRQLSTHLNSDSLPSWRSKIETNLDRLRGSVQGEPHSSNLSEWQRLVDHEDLPNLHRVLTNLDRHSIEMREVSPLGGLLPNDERLSVLSEAS